MLDVPSMEGLGAAVAGVRVDIVSQCCPLKRAKKSRRSHTRKEKYVYIPPKVRSRVEPSRERKRREA